MIDLSIVRLGRAKHDAIKLARVPQHRYATDAPPPAALDRRTIPFVPGLYSNDTLPVCTCVNLANAFRANSWIVKKTDTVTAEAPILGFYAGVVGCAPTPAAIAATDGADMLTVLERAQMGGFDLGQQTPAVPLYASIPPTDRIGVAHAMNTLGSAYLGIRLYAEDMQSGAVWRAAPVGALIGLHCLLSWDYLGLRDDDEVRLPTWGELMPASWAWLMPRIDLAFAVGWG